MNLGQLVFLLRGHYGLDHEFIPLTKIQGRPFTINELIERIGAALK